MTLIAPTPTGTPVFFENLPSHRSFPARVVYFVRYGEAREESIDLLAMFVEERLEWWNLHMSRTRAPHET